MAISFRCPCGQPLEVDEIYAGKQAQCPACNAVVAVPNPAQSPPAAPRVAKRATLVPPPPASLDPRSRRNDADDETDRKFRRRHRDEDEEDEDEEEDEERPRRRRRIPERTHKFWNNSVRGGLIAMVIAVLWFGIGLYFDWIAFYPPILFIIGLIGFIRGIISGRDE